MSATCNFIYCFSHQNACTSCVFHTRGQHEFSLTSYPRRTAMWKDRSCMGMTVVTPCRQSTVCGTSTHLYACACVSTSFRLQTRIGRPYNQSDTALQRSATNHQTPRVVQSHTPIEGDVAWMWGLGLGGGWGGVG